MSALLEVRGLNVEFPGKSGPAKSPPDSAPTTARKIVAVRDLSFTIGSGEVLGLVGESGSGKSVTSLALMRLLPEQARISGDIRFRNGEESARSLLTLLDDEMRQLRGSSIAMIFQEPMTALNPVMRVGDQIAEAVLAHGQVSKAEAWRRAVEGMNEVAIPDAERRARDYPHQLSGGMRQRVMIAARRPARQVPPGDAVHLARSRRRVASGGSRRRHVCRKPGGTGEPANYLQGARASLYSRAFKGRSYASDRSSAPAANHRGQRSAGDRPASGLSL
ncbi:MAG: hypothetical protein DMG81_08835 [Acidobacteria bacterium]|nr:MAG: hypothetical protein DMG81_08835 [Acidobacteriota bacterium]